MKLTAAGEAECEYRGSKCESLLGGQGEKQACQQQDSLGPLMKRTVLQPTKPHGNVLHRNKKAREEHRRDAFV